VHVADEPVAELVWLVIVILQRDKELPSVLLAMISHFPAISEYAQAEAAQTACWLDVNNKAEAIMIDLNVIYPSMSIFHAEILFHK